MRIALTGKMRFGKDTVADMIALDFNCKKVAFLDGIKNVMNGDKPRKYKLYPMELGTYFNYKGLGEFIRL